ncbi:MAG: PilW family protein [Methylophaga sp.]|nr:PilW family protein [Methylophaga sp.]
MRINNIRNQIGFTIIELMIALTIGLFLTAGAVKIFTGTKNINRTQENLSRMQENARFAMYFLTEGLREVGFDGGVCGNGEKLDQAYNNLDTSNAQYQFKTRLLAGQPALYASLSGAIGGADNTGVNGSDSISIRALGGVGRGVALVAPYPANKSDNLSINPAEAGLFAQGDIVLVTDCFTADIFQISNNPAGGTLSHAAGGGLSPKNKTGNLQFIYTNANNPRVYRLSSTTGLLARTYSVANSVGVPGLSLGLDQLVPDIENMQILYGQRQASGGLFYVPSNTAGLDMERVISIRVSLLVRSQDNFVATNPQPYFYNGVDVSGAAIPDRRLRKVYTSTVAVRNRLN